MKHWMQHFMAFTAILASLLLTACGTVRQTAQEKAEAKRMAREVAQKLDSRHYLIDIDYMIPMREAGRPVSLFSISVDDDAIDSYLPYVGQATMIPFDGGKGLTFQEKIAQYTDSGFVGDLRTIVMHVQNDEDNYVYTLEVYDNGTANLYVHSNNRDDISYRGALRLE